MIMSGMYGNNDPILIAGPPRSGTTMLAGLFAQHGVWVGRGRTTQYSGTNPEFVSENQDIKQVMKREAERLQYRNWYVPLPQDFLYHDKYYHDKIKQEILSFVPGEQRWLVKTSWLLVFYKFWMQMWPDARWVMTLRDTDSVLNSMNRHPGMSRRTDHVKRNFIESLQQRQRQVVEQTSNALFVDVFKVSQGSTEEIQRLFDFIKIKVDSRKVRQWIQPGRMRQ